MSITYAHVLIVRSKLFVNKVHFRYFKNKKTRRTVQCVWSGAVAERLRHRSREQRVPSSSPAGTSVLR